MSQNQWIYDWNLAGHVPIPAGTRVMVDDETLRDGLQNPSIHDPTIEEKIEILHLMEALGIDSVNIGLPGAGPRAAEHVEALAREIVQCKMKIRPTARRERWKRIFARLRRFRSAWALPLRPPRFWARARFADWWKSGPSIIWNAPPRRR